MRKEREKRWTHTRIRQSFADPLWYYSFILLSHCFKLGFSFLPIFPARSAINGKYKKRKSFWKVVITFSGVSKQQIDWSWVNQAYWMNFSHCIMTFFALIVFQVLNRQFCSIWTIFLATSNCCLGKLGPLLLMLLNTLHFSPNCYFLHQRCENVTLKWKTTYAVSICDWSAKNRIFSC